ncbi:DUF4403 family protein [Geotalea uraniireducens]|uniref:DUF4403 family protein n=1 Tax=Geotalea uraniireducens (strain Rf4) TaxID=351605 RepID=A5GDK1_GEOUR|nr:DUF4403 family protein [Geotalea uraniireducens]ABQ24342.1 hypothetical protein Gura_0126 [Geotalea uraniireducens Rf4]
MYLLKKTFLPLVLASLALTLSACSGVNPSLTAERPRDEAFRMVLKKEMSSLNVPIEASSDELGKALNQTIRKELYKGSTKTRGLTADIVRNGPIAVSAADNYLYFTLPITMSLSYGMFETPTIPLKLKFKANARITPDWKLNTDIYYLGLSDLLAEDIGIGPLSIKPRSIVEGITQPLQKVLSDLISKKINDMFPLKTRIAKVWNAAQKPVLLDRNYNAWLNLTPREVMLYPLYAQNNRVKLSVGINSFAELVVGPEPAAKPPVPLPNLKLVNTIDRNFRIAMNADLFYKDILKIASPLLLNKEFNSDGKTIVIKDLDLYGNGDKFVVKLETKGSLDGVFYLTGKPRFDPQTNIFSVEDVDFDMQTQSLLLQSADWFLHGTIKSMIQEKLNMDLTQRLEQSREMARKAIAQVQLADHVLLKGNIKTLKFSDVLVQKDKISIQVYTEGESAVFFQ